MSTESVERRADRVALDRIWTLPNALSLLRLVLLGFALFELFDAHRRILAGVLLAVAGSTDFLDGYVARHFHQVSNIGKVLDPTVDRIVLGSSIIAIVIYGAVPDWIAGAVLGREALVAVAVIAISAAGAARIDVLWIGKAGTFGLLVAFPLFLFGDASGRLASDFKIAAFVVVLPSLVASLFSAVAYVPLAHRALVTGRRARHDGAGSSGEMSAVR